jgi:threonine synthase
MNANNTFGEFISGGKFTPHPLIVTNSPALDIVQPSNYERLASFYQEAPAVMRNMVFPAAINDKSTETAMKQAWKEYGVLLDPHSAVAFAAARRFAKTEESAYTHIIVLATGHPAKEAEIVKKTTGQAVELPENLHILSRSVEPVALIDPELEALEGAIASCL